MKSIILKLHENIIKDDKNIKSILETSLQKSNQYKNLNAVISSTYDLAFDKVKDLSKYSDKKNLLYGIPYSLKDNISTQDTITTGGSLFLKKYKPSFNATVYEKLNSSGALLTSKNNLDEFGLGGTGTFSAYGDVKNNFDELYSPGGSSSGAAVLVSTGVVSFAIATDTGDSIRRPASFTNTVGYKPTYGLVSRYGVLPYAPSLDHVGIITSTVADSVIVAQEIIGFDHKDFSSQNKKDLVKLSALQQIKKIKFVVIKNIIELLTRQQKEKFDQLIKLLIAKGHDINYVDVDINLLQHIDAVYQIISYPEAYSCYSNMNGILFGENIAMQNDDFETIIMKNRTQFFGNELKRRFTIGAYLTQKENYHDIYIKAKKIRTLFNQLLQKALNEGDCILLPATSSTANKIADIKANMIKSNLIDSSLLLSNFAGTPSITIPYTFFDKMPWGINITCNVFQDQKMFDIAYTLETLIDEMNGVTNE